MAKKTYIVKADDTLSSIAKKQLGDKNKASYLAKINGIKDPNLIKAGMEILLSSGGQSSSDNKKNKVTGKKAKITSFGLQNGTDRTIFATWAWDKDHTEHYRIVWKYYTGDGVGFIGSDSTVTVKQAVYDAPSNATKVSFKVKPVAKKKKVNGKETNGYWESEFTKVKEYFFKNNPPEKPSSPPTVKIEGDTLTASLDNLNINATHIYFEVVQNNSGTVFAARIATIDSGYSSMTCNVNAGSSYKVRCRAVRGNEVSEYTEYSSPVETKPSTPSGITKCVSTTKTSVHLEWTTVENATTYEVEYTTNVTYFEGSDGTTKVGGIEANHYDFTNLESGHEYFFRVRAVNDAGTSGWSGIASTVLGKAPAAPTTWSSATTVITGETLILYWVHNAQDGSSETVAELELRIDGKADTITIKKSTDEDEKDKTSFYEIKTTSYPEGTKIQWRVRTAGVTKEYGPFSVMRTIDVYSPPTLMLNILSSPDGPEVNTILSFPFYVRGFAGPKTQAPIGYHMSVISNQAYDTVDNLGNEITVNKGEEIYSKYFDTGEMLLVELSAGNIDLENNMSYTVTCVVSMNSGLTATESREISVAWVDEEYFPNAETIIDPDTLVAHIRPYVEVYPFVYYKVIHESGEYKKTEETLDNTIEGISLDDIFTTTGEMVYSASTSSGEVLFCMEESSTGVLVDGITLSVYRREYDGSFTEIATGIDNMQNTFTTDPHPALDFARYRIVAIVNDTGAVSYYDMPGLPIHEKAVIIQWDEAWTNFNTTSEDALEHPAWSGSLLRLPYNIDVSDKTSADVELIEYIGRKHPVSYYGTQLGITSVWNVDIDKEDKDTLYALRRLAIWMGDVYVREPSGSGYWANVSVSFNQNHDDVTIPVTLEIKRVEGGM